MKPLDYTLYKKVKEKFPPQPLTVIFVSLKPENLEDLRACYFKIEDLPALMNFMGQHNIEAIPFAAIGGFEEGEVGYNFSSLEFEQREDLNTGRIVHFSAETYHNKALNLEVLKNEMQNFSNCTLLSGNS